MLLVPAATDEEAVCTYHRDSHPNPHIIHHLGELTIPLAGQVGGQPLLHIPSLATSNAILGFTTFAFSTLAASVHENTMLSFDTDSTFWVCNNLATGHICNDKNLFTGDLVPSIYIVGAATGTLEPTLMGMVKLRITDDGEKHKFTLTHVNYMPTSRVNLLLTRVFSKQFTDANGIDLHGTGIHSCYEDHTLLWDHGKFRKTFKTHDSGLPECLFRDTLALRTILV
jgi:hypothetical protein